MSNLSGINEIFERCTKGIATEEDRLLFWKWAETPGNEEAARQMIEYAFPSTAHPVHVDADTFNSMIEAILNANKNLAGSITNLKPLAGHLRSDSHSQAPVHRIRFLKTSWFRYAAAILILCGMGAYLWKSNREQEQVPVVKSDIAPGHEGAILTLADGKQVLLDSLGNGTVALQSGTEVFLKDGRLAYNAVNADAVTYNTMTTPRGRQFSVQLPDGSKAWLNAASSITYPTAFNGADRSVKISGEVYFEITKDLKKPFKVKVNDDNEIQVLGTGFNVKAYTDDALITTTLLEGAVRLNSFKHMQTLKPGQQTRVNADGQITLVNNADVTKIMAWKNGLFNFQDESLEEVMKQLERWYDIQVKFAGNPPVQKFFGEIQRDLTLSQVIETLREIGIRVKIEGRTLIVMP